MRVIHVSLRSQNHAASGRGFTLIETLLAIMILSGVVITVTSLMTAGHQRTEAAQRMVVASLAAEELMELVLREDTGDLLLWDGWLEEPGHVTDLAGALQQDYRSIGRGVRVLPVRRFVAPLQIVLDGHEISIRTWDRDGRPLVALEHFKPEPAS